MTVSVTNAIETHDVVETFLVALHNKGCDPSQMAVGFHNAICNDALELDGDSEGCQEILELLSQVRKLLEKYED